MKIICKRCNGSGEIGLLGSLGVREAPGPVPEDARGWRSADCPSCGGTGEQDADEEVEAE